MKTAVEIIPATESHVPEIVEMWKEFLDFHREIDPFYTRREDGHMMFGGYVRSLIDADDSLVLAALDGDNVVAYSICRIAEYPPVHLREKYGFISDMAVKSSHRRMGIGESMLAEVLAWFESHNMDRIELHVVAKNNIGYSFWKKHGFKDYVHILCRNK